MGGHFSALLGASGEYRNSRGRSVAATAARLPGAGVGGCPAGEELEPVRVGGARLGGADGQGVRLVGGDREVQRLVGEYAAPSQSSTKSWESSSRNQNRAKSGRPRRSVVGLPNTGDNRARASALLATMSRWPLVTKAADRVMESSSHWTWGGTSTALRRRRGAGLGWGGFGEVEQVGAFDVVQPQGAGHSVEDVTGDAADVALLQPGVPLGAHSGENRDLLAAQPRHPAPADRVLPETLPEDPNPVLARFFEWTAPTPMSFFGFQLMTDIDMLAPRKALLVVGADAHSRYYSEDVQTMSPENIELVSVQGADHVDLYDQTDIIPFDTLDEFLTKNLA